MGKYTEAISLLYGFDRQAIFIEIRGMKKLVILIVCLSLVVLSCTKERMEGDILIRVNNQSGKELSDVSVFSLIPGEPGKLERRYGTVMPASISRYQPHKEVASLPLFRFIMQDAGLFEIQNIRCGMGLTYLTPGKYSLIIREENNSPYAYLQKD
jgi:hypothetical protein